MMNLNKRCTIKSSIHFGNLSEYIPKLWKIGKYVDVTLSCEGRKFKCHRIVLGAASRLLDSLFTDNQCQHPIVIIPSGITAVELRIAIQFMYNGKVDLKMSELSGFMKVAQLLKLRGFRDLDSSEDFQLEMIEDDVSVHQIITIPENDNEDDIDYNEDDDINDVNDDDDDVAIINENDLDDDSDLELDYDAILAQETVRKPEANVQNKQDTKNSTPFVGKIRVTNNDFLFEKTLNTNRKHLPSATNTQANNSELPQEYEVKTEYVDDDESTMNQEDDFAYENIVCAPSISYIYSNGANGMQGQSENPFVDFETSDNFKTYQNTEEKDGSKGEYPLLVPYSESQMSNQNSIWSTFYGSSKAIRSKPTVKRERKVTISNPVILNKNLELTQDEVVLRSPRSNQPRTYSTKALYDALMAVKEGESIYRASREHSVPRKTLRNWMKRWNIKSKHPMPAQLREAAGRKKKKDETIIKFKTDIFANLK